MVTIWYEISNMTPIKSKTQGWRLRSRHFQFRDVFRFENEWHNDAKLIGWKNCAPLWIVGPPLTRHSVVNNYLFTATSKFDREVENKECELSFKLRFLVVDYRQLWTTKCLVYGGSNTWHTAIKQLPFTWTEFSDVF